MKRSLLVSSLYVLLVLPAGAATDCNVTLAEVKEAVGYLMDDVSSLRKEINKLNMEISQLKSLSLALKKQQKVLESKVSFLEARLKKKEEKQKEIKGATMKKNRVPETTSSYLKYFLKEDYDGPIIFAGAFKKFHFAVKHAQEIINAGFPPDILLLRSGLFSVVVRNENATCSALQEKHISCFKADSRKRHLKVFPISRLLFSSTDASKVNGFEILKSNTVPSDALLYRKIESGYLYIRRIK